MGSGEGMKQRFDWIEFHPKPKKDGLHDSGYRYIRLVGVKKREDEKGNRLGNGLDKTELNQWSDHVVINGFASEFGGANIDVEADGTIRIMPWAETGLEIEADSFYSSAEIKVVKE